MSSSGQDDTFTRSCAHWSAEHRAGMEAFYRVASWDYRVLAGSRDWAAWLETPSGPIQVLDVACGSGKFPRALADDPEFVEAAAGPIRMGLLDPSAFSIDETRQGLRPPFQASVGLCCRLQDLDTPHRFDRGWAMHALYAIPEDELGTALSRWFAHMQPGSRIVIGHSSASGHYLQCYEAYLAGVRGGQGTPYCSGEAIIDALGGIGLNPTVTQLSYDNGGELSPEIIEGFLQRCLFDDSLTLPRMLDAPHLGDYLRRCHDGVRWQFQQQVLLIDLEL